MSSNDLILVHSEVVALEIRFRPETEGVFEEKMTLICDNCCVKHFALTGKGVPVDVQLLEVGHETFRARSLLWQ